MRTAQNKKWSILHRNSDGWRNIAISLTTKVKECNGLIATVPPERLKV
jgi:hypothetical protein